ncbi:Aldo/keto reductase [Agrocybe pediades]|nr:Aldo/keto reductase [Agrocybe pediades]
MSSSIDPPPSVFPPPPPPASGLARYRLLSPRAAGARVSPIQLGGMSIGDKWGAVLGAMNKEDSWRMLDAYFEKGGNFIDTANFYQEGSSEEFIGEWAETRGIRDRLFIATKYTNNAFPNSPDGDRTHRILSAGNNAKSIHISIRESLKRLRTDYIDLFYVHWWDFDASVEEVMHALHALVLQGKVIYLGVSDTPAWVVSMANQYARDHALTPFSVYQGQWNVLERSFERDIIPMAKNQGMALAPWDVLCGGKIRTDAEEARREASAEYGRGGAAFYKRTPAQRAMSQALEKVAEEVGAKSITSVAIAYVMQKTSFVFPIIGGRKVEHMLQNLEALEISLSEEQIRYIESVVPFEAGFPNNIVGDGTAYKDISLVNGNIDKQVAYEPIRPNTASSRKTQ